MASFNAFAWESFFFGQLDRREAERMLANSEVGTFLIRESSTTSGYSICIKVADGHFMNYLIEKVEENPGGKISYKISTRSFPDMPTLINHFKVNNLTTEPAPIKLTRPLEKGPIEKVMAKYSFDGERISDLPFERGELLEVLGKPEVGWWLARNALGDTGMIPANRVKSLGKNGRQMTQRTKKDVRIGFSIKNWPWMCEDGAEELSILNPSTGSGGEGGNRSSANSGVGEQQSKPEAGEPKRQLRTNSWVKVVVPRVPSIYDADSLTIKCGQFLYVQEILPNGMCRGTDGSKSGFFPITYVEPANVEPGLDHPLLANGN